MSESSLVSHPARPRVCTCRAPAKPLHVSPQTNGHSVRWRHSVRFAWSLREVSRCFGRWRVTTGLAGHDRAVPTSRSEERTLRWFRAATGGEEGHAGFHAASGKRTLKRATSIMQVLLVLISRCCSFDVQACSAPHERRILAKGVPNGPAR